MARRGGTAWGQSGLGDARWSDQVNFRSCDSRERIRLPKLREGGEDDH